MKKVYIKWLDSSGFDGWIGKHEFPETLQEIETFGFLVSEYDDRIVVCSHISNHTLGNPMVIPKFAITQRELIE